MGTRQNNRRYLREEEYQKNNKKVKIAGTIVILIGICLLAAGIIKLVDVSKMESVPMLAPNWFEIESAKDDKTFAGVAMLMFGGFITIVGCCLRFVVANEREIMAYEVQERMPIVQESVERMTPTMRNATREVVRGAREGWMGEETRYCKYCGAQISADSVFCNKCGKPQA